MDGSLTQDPIVELITNYHELNSSIIEELDGEPSPLEFMRFVAKNTPFVDPDAINLWIGTARSTTALHKDNYENMYVQVAGQKHFVLLPPACQPCVRETRLPPAVYVRSGDGLALVVEEGEEAVPFATWDPDRPGENETEYSRLARPMRVTLEEGDMLYLPALWYHKVSQSCSPEGVCIAVNYWYDMDFSGPLHALSSFVRSVSSNKSKK
ncbi:Clavaminate synthase-like protein [Trichocladium antarcticum]|uniref:Clavaminate synthase-like protein n=1 Tax=Trichocladium antarcticum TaxID=1450529 RepID=A0AAN6ZHC3_9PEZI|nr:Clavaminate synthase-like protein [Trichocladium antarcticum]